MTLSTLLATVTDKNITGEFMARRLGFYAGRVVTHIEPIKPGNTCPFSKQNADIKLVMKTDTGKYFSKYVNSGYVIASMATHFTELINNAVKAGPTKRSVTPTVDKSTLQVVEDDLPF